MWNMSTDEQAIRQKWYGKYADLTKSFMNIQLEINNCLYIQHNKLNSNYCLRTLISIFSLVPIYVVLFRKFPGNVLGNYRTCKINHDIAIHRFTSYFILLSSGQSSPGESRSSRSRLLRGCERWTGLVGNNKQIQSKSSAHRPALMNIDHMNKLIHTAI